MFDSRGLIFWSSEIGVGWGRASTAQSVLSDHIALSRASLSHLLNSMVLYNDCVLRLRLYRTNLRWNLDGFFGGFSKISLDLAFCIYTAGWENYNSAGFIGTNMTWFMTSLALLQEISIGFATCCVYTS